MDLWLPRTNPLRQANRDLERVITASGVSHSAPHGAVLAVDHAEWTAFLDGISDGVTR